MINIKHPFTKLLLHIPLFQIYQKMCMIYPKISEMNLILKNVMYCEIAVFLPRTAMHIP